jgi:hypothetical protein
LSARSIAYALSVAGALFRWLIQQRYCLANPFAGIKVRGVSAGAPQALQRAFGEGEWAVIQAVAEGLEWVHGWEPAAAQRLRFPAPARLSTITGWPHVFDSLNAIWRAK